MPVAVDAVAAVADAAPRRNREFYTCAHAALANGRCTATSAARVEPAPHTCCHHHTDTTLESIARLRRAFVRCGPPNVCLLASRIYCAPICCRIICVYMCIACVWHVWKGASSSRRHPSAAKHTLAGQHRHRKKVNGIAAQASALCVTALFQPHYASFRSIYLLYHISYYICCGYVTGAGAQSHFIILVWQYVASAHVFTYNIFTSLCEHVALLHYANDDSICCCYSDGISVLSGGESVN